ncbi:hypothetical protein NLJ89_g529 [Agrocybe chaxingu]|uniref:Uncharacterized protein n=1 Tax=Agrocybe chaxingu TaxID=84603 RepID=A0A9W8N1T6_9AGAR|nr:hypothetical protein NLJ89_g529 [Agrocybe chaxingu]
MARAHRVAAVTTLITIAYLLTFFNYLSVPLLDEKIAVQILPVVRSLPDVGLFPMLMSAPQTIHSTTLHVRSIANSVPVQTGLRAGLNIQTIYPWADFDPPSHRRERQQLPWWLLVSFGSYSLWSIGTGLLTLRECPEAYNELVGDFFQGLRELWVCDLSAPKNQSTPDDLIQHRTANSMPGFKAKE